MIVIEARILQNIIEIDDEGTRYEARPKGWNEKGLKGAWKRFVTTDYILFDKDENILGSVFYDGKKDEIAILKEKKILGTKHLWFKPDQFEYKGKLYNLHEKLNGTIVITHREKVVASGEIKGFQVPRENLQTWKIPGEGDKGTPKERAGVWEKIVAKGKAGFTTVRFIEYEEDLREILKFLGTGYCIKMLLLQMFI